jgi:hypothetical protein
MSIAADEAATFTDPEVAPANPAECLTGCERPVEKPILPLYAGVVQYPPPNAWYDSIENFRHGFEADGGRPFPRNHEMRAEIESIEWLLEYRRTIAQRLAPLATMHKHGGKWDETRRAIRGVIAAEIRKSPKAHGVDKAPSGEAMTDLACGDPRYIDAIRKARREDIEYEELKNELENLDLRIKAREIANYQHNAEARVQ